ncbi:hypothetical protein [Plantibacter sp. lyk4-40-MEA-4]|uniref:hypothetical protein n=1 Tax=Plantibacter sp. lyk4-40-MEA-4 TaxID=3040298 RepID=UPI00254CF703|nr:hypothetical protein [Plantibacter sp. lyk4-40-MEA-4]
MFGILTAAAFVFALVFFAATQQITGRDWVVLGIGALFGATAASLIATFIFHADTRATMLSTEASIAQFAADAETARQDKVAAAETALIEKRTALITALPTRRERLSELDDQIAQVRISIIDADGRYKAGVFQAADAAQYGFGDIAHENQSAARGWEVAKTRFEGQLADAEADRGRLGAMTDAEYLNEQKRLRGLE